MAKKKNASKKASSRKVVIGVVDTMFARFDMGGAARNELANCPGFGSKFKVLSATVPGFKDLAVAAKNMIERDGADIVVALGMPGSAPIDKQCAHEASTGIMQAQLMTSTPILEVFVHEDESDDPATLRTVFENRSRDHARNAYWMIFEPEQLARRAGQGVRQGFDDAGPLEETSSRARHPARASRAAKAATGKKRTTLAAVSPESAASSGPISATSPGPAPAPVPAIATPRPATSTTISVRDLNPAEQPAAARPVETSEVVPHDVPATSTVADTTNVARTFFVPTTEKDDVPTDDGRVSDVTHPYRSGPGL